MGWLHWTTHGGYNFVSGPFADVTILTGFAGGFWLWLRKHNCHVHKCWRLQWHPHPVHGHPVCRHHHPDHKQIVHMGRLGDEIKSKTVTARVPRGSSAPNRRTTR